MSGLDAIDLPNDQWIRSHKLPEWALCLDPQDRFYGWKCQAVNGRWVTQAKISDGDIEVALERTSLQEHWPKFDALRASHQTKAKQCDPPCPPHLCSELSAVGMCSHQNTGEQTNG